tara:strand:+ start:9407 stop:9865 length:459 start_codon:yes stop_codon:yes gene_type:complete
MNPLQEIGAQLAQELEKALPRWVEVSVRDTYEACGGEWHEQIEDETLNAGLKCANDLMQELTELFGADAEQQSTNPMSVLRKAAVYPTEVLLRNGIPPLQRDEYAEMTFPQDIYDLTPTAFLDFGQRCHELGITWGAAKAHAHFAQRREVES